MGDGLQRQIMNSRSKLNVGARAVPKKMGQEVAHSGAHGKALVLDIVMD